jgi:endonuclease YncB( thermonuclease family)
LRRIRLLIAFAIVAGAAMGFVVEPPSLPTIFAQGSVSGIVEHVRDGDTIVVSGQPIRLQGVSAPESGTRHGQAATEFMVRLVKGKTVQCDDSGERSYDRIVAVCFLNGRDIGEAIISAGYALECRRYSGGRYTAAERAGQALYRLSGYSLPGYCR